MAEGGASIAILRGILYRTRANARTITAESRRIRADAAVARARSQVMREAALRRRGAPQVVVWSVGFPPTPRSVPAMGDDE